MKTLRKQVVRTEHAFKKGDRVTSGKPIIEGKATILKPIMLA